MTAILDLDSIAFAAACDRVLRDEEGNAVKGDDGKSIYVPKTLEQIQEDTDKVMNDILSSCGADSYIGFIKSSSGIPTFRYDINPEYKANREKETPAWWEPVKQRLVDTWSAIIATDYEVDDYVNITRLSIPDSFIVAIDKDLLDLEGTHYNWKKKEWVTVEAFQAKYWFWRDMITGQPGDNIKGIPGKGKRFVEKIFDLREPETFRLIVLDEYCNHFGEYLGIHEFNKNYYSLRLLESFEEVGKVALFPQPIPYAKEVAPVNI